MSGITRSDEILVSDIVNIILTTELFKTMSNKKNLALFTGVNITSRGASGKIKDTEGNVQG